MINSNKSVPVEKTNTKNELLCSWIKANEIIAGFFTLVIIAIFPLVFRDFYFDMLKVKYIFYYGTVILMAVVTLIVGLVFLYLDGRDYRWKSVKQLCHNINIKQLKPADWAIIVFFCAAAISTLQSDYIYESFWGNEGRFMGLFLIILYVVSYFIISRFLKFKQWYLDAFLAAGMIACIIGILQYFNIDPIGFKTNIDPDQYAVFTSTIGNINTYTSYVALIAGMGSVLFTIEKNLVRKCWYLFTVIISIFALITGVSDNAYLAILALFGLLPLYLFNNIKGIKNYSLLTSILFTEFQIINSINLAFPEQVLGINSLFNLIAGYDNLSKLITVLWGVTIILHVLDGRGANINIIQKKSNTGRWIWLGVIIAVLLCGCYVLYDVNIVGNADKYGSLKKYLVINDNWGSQRWYIWRIAMESYAKFPLLHKIFGYGPDTFGIITVNNYYEEMITRYKVKFDSVHNEYLQYLITIGIIGLIAYISVLCTSVMQMIRTSKKLPAVLAIVFALLCYGAQATVNISVPIVSPIMMTLLMVGVAAGRENRDFAGSA